MKLIEGYQVHYDRHIYPRPRLERTRFSGGVNNTAEGRNAARLKDWRESMRVIVDKANRIIIVPDGMRHEFEASMAKAGVR